MASTSKCQYCGSTVSSEEKTCPSCGAANPNYVADTPRTVFLPKTIEELKEYCAERGMPLLRMRFFIGEDFREPRAFGIYRDGEDVVVYKNKSDGSRAIRYRGPDEAHGVNELFQKLLDECHNRGIYPDGKPAAGSVSGTKKKKSNAGRLARFLAIWLGFIILSGLISNVAHKNDGYYSNGNGRIYYRYGSDWYYTYEQGGSGYWYETNTFVSGDYEDYYLGSSYDSDWGGSNFKSSSTWASIQESHSSSSSDYDSWDSSSTDWDSDW